MKKLTKLTGIILLSIIILTEIILRLGFQNKLRTRTYPLIYQPDSIIGYRYIPNANSKIVKPSINHKVHINNQGYYGKDFSTKKKAGTYRIVVSGDSNTTGIWSDGLETYLGHVQKLFDKNKVKVEIINCAIDGGNRTIKNIHQIKTELIYYEPDLILLAPNPFPFCNHLDIRDIYKDYVLSYPTQYPKAKIDYLKTYIDSNYYRINSFRILYDMSFIYRYLCKYYRENDNKYTKWMSSNLKLDKAKIKYYIDKKVKIGNPVQLFTINESIMALTDLKLFLEDKGINFAIYTEILDRDSEIMKYVLEDMCQIKYLNLDVPYAPSYSTKYDGHINQLGHEVIGNIMYKRLLSDGLVPAEYQNQTSERKTGSKPVNQKAQINLTLKDINLKSDYNKVETLNDSLYQVLIIHRPYHYQEFPKHHVSYLRNITKNYNIKIIDKTLPETLGLENYFLALNSIIMKNQSNLTFIEYPNILFGINPENTITLLNEYITYLHEIDIETKLYSTKQDQNGSFFKYAYERSSGKKIIESDASFMKDFYERRENDYTNNLIQKITACNLSETLIKYYESNYSREYVKNIALNKPVIASSSTEKGSWSTKNLVDGVQFTFIEKTGGWISAENSGKRDHVEWVQIDLCKVYNIEKIILYPRDEVYFEGHKFPIDFEVLISEDSINWEKIYEITDNKNPKDSQPKIINVQGSFARYVKIVGTKLDNERMNFAEVEVYSIIN